MDNLLSLFSSFTFDLVALTICLLIIIAFFYFRYYELVLKNKPSKSIQNSKYRNIPQPKNYNDNFAPQSNYKRLILSSNDLGWLVGILAVIVTYYWILEWILDNPQQISDKISINTILILICLTVTFISMKKYEPNYFNQTVLKTINILNYISLGGAILLIAIFISLNNFDIIYWLLLGSRSISRFVLAY